MLKKILVQQLKKGMYLHKKNHSLFNHQFVFSGPVTDSNLLITKFLKHGIKEIYIDEGKSLITTPVAKNKEVKIKKEEYIESKIEEKQDYPQQFKIEVELQKAIQIRNEARKVVTNLMRNIRGGRKIEISAGKNVVKKIVDSVIRNKYALSSIAAIKQKNEYLFQHAVSCCALMVSFGITLDYKNDELIDMGIGALMHDIGKMKIPTQIINKPSSLTISEFEEMKKHVQYGNEILAQIDYKNNTVFTIMNQHHERINGSGYPKKLKGNEISHLGKMASIVDVYDALISDRGYNKALEPTTALSKIFAMSGKLFDEVLVQKFIKSIGIYPFGTLVKLNSGKLALVVEINSQNLLTPIVRVFYDINKRSFLTPFNIDLSNSQNKNKDKIINTELREKWFLKKEDINKILGINIG